MPYSTRVQVELVYGAVTIKDWADLDGTDDPAEITARISWAIAKADTYIDAKMRRRNFDVPFSVVPAIIKDISADLAGYNLYSARMLDGGDRTKDNLSHKRKEALITLTDIVSGNLILDLDMVDHTDAPFVVTS